MDLSGAQWRKSSFSNGDTAGDGCIEMAYLPDDTVALRDTKDRARAPHRYSGDEWHHFLAAIRAGQFSA